MSKEKRYKNGLAIQLDRKNGKFITTPKSVLLNKNLTDKAKILFQLLVDTPSDSKISLEYYRKILEWSKDTMTKTFENLRLNGYTRYEKHPKGKDNGFTYSFLLSEYGNLKIEDKDESDSTLDTEAHEPAPESKVEPIKTDNEIKLEYEKALQEEQAHVKKVCDDKMEGGTIAQRKESINKTLKFWNSQLEKGIAMTDDEIRHKVFVLHHITKTANREMDERYND